MSGRSAKVLLIGGALTLFAFSGAAAQPGSGGVQDLNEAVTEEMSQKSGKDLPVPGQRSAASSGVPGTQVNVMRQAESGGEGWAFGTAVIEAPKKRGHYPQGWLFVGRETDEGWDLEFEGTPEFAELADEAPTKVVSEKEQSTFKAQRSGTGSAGDATGTGSSEPTRQTASTGTRTGLMLPWAKGKAWYFTGGPHGWGTGYDRPYSSLDLVGRGADQNVRSVAPGNVYNMCGSGRGWIRVYHPNGYTTDYYHLANNIRPQAGAYIRRGTVLGQTGQDVSCGGQSFGRHVHFSILRGETRAALNGRQLGGWTFQEGQAYGGSATRGSTIRYPGGSTLLVNYGAKG